MKQRSRTRRRGNSISKVLALEAGKLGAGIPLLLCFLGVE